MPGTYRECTFGNKKLKEVRHLLHNWGELSFKNHIFVSKYYL